jgi:6-phosphogluconolactonase
MTQTRVYTDRDALAEAASDLIMERISAGLDARGLAFVILSGGSTPRECYGLLARKIVQRRIPVDRILWIFADERWVPVSHPDSNEGMARRMLLAPIEAPEHAILSWQAGSGDPVERALSYRERIAAHLDGRRPDLGVLGMGADGHTASLFPGSLAVLADGQRLSMRADLPAESVAVFLEKEDIWRLTLCPAFLNRARSAVFLVADAAKKAPLALARRGDPSLPASWIHAEETLFLVTREAFGEEPFDVGREVRFA